MRQRQREDYTPAAVEAVKPWWRPEEAEHAKAFLEGEIELEPRRDAEYKRTNRDRGGLGGKSPIPCRPCGKVRRPGVEHPACDAWAAENPMESGGVLDDLVDHPRRPNIGARESRSVRVLDSWPYAKAVREAPYIQLNPKNCYSVLLVDVDRPAMLDVALEHGRTPAPSWLTERLESGHRHVAFMLKEPVHDNAMSSRAALDYFGAVETALASVIGGDRGFGQRSLVMNPAMTTLFSRTTLPNPEQIPRFELAGLIPQGVNLREVRKDGKADSVEWSSVGRNRSLFYAASVVAGEEHWGMVKNGGEADYAALEGRVIEPEVRRRNAEWYPEYPLASGECAHIVRSISKRARRWRHRRRFRGQASGRAGGVNRRAALVERNREICALAKCGLTQSDIAFRFGLTQQSVSLIIRAGGS